MNPRTTGFSLIEVLVVAAVIIILSSFLLPAIRLVRHQANGAKCAGNLRQIHLASTGYSLDNRGLIVRSAFGASAGAPTHFWQGYLGEYVDASTTGSDSINDLRQRNTVLWGCPEYPIKPATPWYTGYGMNCWLREPDRDPGWRMYTNAWLGSAWSGNWNIGVFTEFRLASITLASVRPLIGDRDDDWTIYYAAGLPHQRHRGETNMLYCDGHTGRVPAKDVRGIVQNPQ